MIQIFQILLGLYVIVSALFVLGNALHEPEERISWIGAVFMPLLLPIGWVAAIAFRLVEWVNKL